MKNDAKVITPEEYWDSLSDIQYYMDEPVADPAAVALYFLSKEAAKKVKLCFRVKDRMNCSEDIIFTVNLLNILLLIKSRCRSGALWENLQNTVCRGG